MNENENDNEIEKNNLEYKIITLGDSSVGKTSIINRFINDTFDEELTPTLGIKHTFKTLEINNTKVKLSVIDTNGQEKYRSLSVSYFRHADVVLFIFNLNEPLSFNNIQEWINVFNDNNNKKKVILKYLIGSKSDLEQRVEQNLIDEFANNNNMLYMATSAKTNNQINELFQKIGEDILEEEEKKTNNMIRTKNSSRILLKTKEKNRKKCC
jgi:small GTP-binding protein